MEHIATILKEFKAQLDRIEAAINDEVQERKHRKGMSELANYCGVSVATLYSWRKKGYITIGEESIGNGRGKKKAIYWNPDEVDKQLAAMRHSVSEE